METIDAPGDAAGRHDARRIETYDLIIRGGCIAKLGLLDDAIAPEVIDAVGAIVAPGIVDVHTHYDPQITDDPYATMSCYHGVTTVVAGICRRGDVHFLQDNFASVEDMAPKVLGGVRWDNFESYWNRMADTRRDRAAIRDEERQPYGLIPAETGI